MGKLDSRPAVSVWPARGDRSDESMPVVHPLPPLQLDDGIPTLEPVEPIGGDIPTLRPVPTVLLAEPLPRRGFWGTIFRVVGAIASACEWCFGLVALLLFLSALAAIPILQFLSLGYLLEASGRVARTGKLRNGFIGVRTAARAGGLVLGIWLMLLPLRLVSSFWYSAQLIDPDGLAAKLWGIGLFVLTGMMLVHIAMALASGGKLRHFLIPFLNPLWVALDLCRGRFWGHWRDAVWNFTMRLRLPYYFWLGFRGFWGAFLWLAGPITLLAIGRKVPPVGFLGAFLLVWVLLYVPFLQLHFVVQNRFRAFLELGTVRRQFRKAPVAFAFAFFITLLFSVPLYLLKIEMIPREAAWLPSLVFILFMLPARLLSGWAFGRSLRREAPRHWFFRWPPRFGMLGVTVLYAVIVYFSQYAAWEGIWSLYEQHAFLLPVPFLGM